MAVALAADLQFIHCDRGSRGLGGQVGRAERAGCGALDAVVSATVQFQMRECLFMWYVFMGF